jgi:hypothetical protein
MNIISTTDKSRYGNDCYIYETVSLIEQFGMYAIITCQKVAGWAEREDISISETTTDYNKAVNMYEYRGGILED